MPPLPGAETILVVDDEIAVLSLTTMMLTRYGYTVLTAASGKEASTQSPLQQLLGPGGCGVACFCAARCQGCLPLDV